MKKIKNILHKPVLRRIQALLCIFALLLSLSPSSLNAVVYAQDTKDTTYYTRDPFYNFSSSYNYYQSDHFQFIWGNSGDASKVTSAFLAGNAKNMEDCWKVYMEDLGMAAPSQSTNISLRDGKNYKTNIYISGTGLSGMENDWAYMSYDSGSFAYLFCCVDAMAYNPPSWVLPHEFGHAVTAHQLGWNNNKYSYAWWEAMGNWFREQYLSSDYSTDTTGYGTDFFETYLKNSSLTFPCGRDYYAAWPFLQYLAENPDNLDGYGANFMRTLLQQGQVDEYPLNMIDRLANADMKETLGNYAKRMATLDFKNQSAYRSRLNELLAQGDWNWQQIYTMLESETGKDNWYQVPTERAPQQAGLNIVPLDINGSIVSVTLNGLTKVDGADWRACIVLEDKSGNSTYSKLFKSGETATMAVTSNTASAYLTVVATPDTDTYVKVGLPYGPDSEFAENNYSYSSKTQYPYEVLITGATPQKRTVTSYSGSYHANGGGFVADTATVDSSVYVGPNAKVLGYAKVTGNAVIDDYAVVEGSATVSSNAIVDGYAMVCENANVSGNAHIGDYGLVMGNATINGNAKVIESACVYGTYSMTDNAIAKGMAFCMANGSISGQGIVDGDYYDDGGKTVTKGTAYGWVSTQSYVNALSYTDGLYTGYNFTSDSSNTVKDLYTSTYGTSYGTPLWQASRTSANGVLTFDGSSQYVTVDRSLTYFKDTELQTAVLWKGGADNQKVFSFGDGNGSEMYFTPSNTNKVAEFVITNGTNTYKLTSKAPLTKGSWSTVRIILKGDTGKLMINNTTVATGTVVLDPEDISGDASYLARGTSGGYFNGSMDYFRVFFKEVSAPTESYTGTEDTTTPTIAPTATVTPTVTPTAKPTVTPTVAPTAKATVTPTAKPTVTPTVSPTAKPTTSPTATPSDTLKLITETNAWSDAYSMNMSIKNTSNYTVSDWKLTVNKADFNITNIWNAKITVSGDYLIITPLSWNQTISAGGTVSFGFQATGNPVANFAYQLN